MQQTQVAATPTFEGTDEERQLAEQVYTLARFQGRFFAATAAINLRRDDLVQFIASRDGERDPATLAAALDAALGRNPAIFSRSETDDGVVSYATTRGGTAPVPVSEDLAHSLPERFLNPPEVAPPLPPKPAPRIPDAWSQRPTFDGLPGEPETVELGPPARLDALGDIAAVEAGAAAEPATTDELIEAIVAADVAAAPPAGVDAVLDGAEVRPAPLPAVDPAPAFGNVPAEVLRAALADRLGRDDRFAQFGDRYYNEDLVERYSRGDLRRIREYIIEVTEPLSDDALLQDLFGRRANDPSYEAARFSINFRLSREKRDFEFAGTRDSRVWATGGLAPIGTTLRKASDLGTDFRPFLDEPAPDAPVGTSVTHVLTFFEWTYGLLPLDGTLRTFFPQPYLEDQKTAVLRFEVPQLFATFLAELRYPTANRGGYLVGFDEFYRENLVPGAVMTIDRTPNNDGQFVLRYTTTPAREVRLLQIDDRRNRYVFRSQTTYAQVNEDWLPAESRYPRLTGAKPLDDRERRRPEVVIGTAFERAAENVGTKGAPRYWSAPEELLPVVNIERPFTLRLLRETLESPQFPQFVADPDTPGAFFYEPPATTGAARPKKRSAVLEQEEDLDLDLNLAPDSPDDEE